MTATEKLQTFLPKESTALVLFAPNTRRWLTGFPSSDGCVLLTKKEALFFTDSRYIEAATKQISDYRCVQAVNLYEAIGEALNERGVTTLLTESETLTVGVLHRLQKTLSDCSVCADKTLDRKIADLRSVKTAAEMAALKQAQALTDDGFRYILERLEPGRTERDIALDLEFYMRRQGAEGVSFEFIVVSGENSSLPHGVPTHRVLQRGDFVTMDFGALWQGLHADMTRTVAIGEVSDEQRQVYETVLAAQTDCLDTVRAGVTGAAADAAARDVIAAAGYGDYFGHATGHGVGFDIHESPTLAPRAKDTVLRAGQVVTVEPGIYLPGKFGVRIEDMVYVTENGAENLTHSEKSLLIV